MTIPTKLGLKLQQMSDEISYKPGKYLTKHLVLLTIVLVICLLIIASNIPRFVNPTFEEEIIKKVSTKYKVKLYGFKHQRRSLSEETKTENVKPGKDNPQKSKTEKANPNTNNPKPKKAKPAPKGQKCTNQRNRDHSQIKACQIRDQNLDHANIGHAGFGKKQMQRKPRK